MTTPPFSAIQSEKLTMLRGSKWAGIMAGAAHWFLFILRDLWRAVKPSSKSDTQSNRGPMTKLFGWPPPKMDPARETAWLDGLRGVAAFLVMIYHSNLEFFGASLEAPYGAPGVGAFDIWRLPFLRVFFCSGHAQVCVFFVLSGFVLSWGPLKILRSGQHDRLVASLGSAVFRRWFRLFLPCFVVAFFSLLTFRWGLLNLSREYYDSFWAQVWDYIIACDEFSNFLYIERSGMSALHQYSWVMWTIPHEWAGSLLVFLLLLGVGRMRHYPRRTTIVMGVAAYATYRAYWNYWLFASGLMIADYVQHNGGFVQLTENTGRKFRISMVVMWLLGLLLCGVPENSVYFSRPGYEWLDKYYPWRWTNIEGGMRFYWSWAGIFLLFSGCHLAIIRHIFELPFARYLGRLSFMLYLVHRPLSEIFSYPFRLKMRLVLGVRVHDDGTNLDFYVTSASASAFIYVTSWLILAPLTFVVSHWAEVLIDAPLTRFSRWLDDQFMKVPETAAQEEELGLLPS